MTKYCPHCEWSIPDGTECFCDGAIRERWVEGLDRLYEACLELKDNYGSGRCEGLVEVPSEVMGSILAALQNLESL